MCTERKVKADLLANHGASDSYTATLLERIDEAHEIIGNMCEESRPPKMALPAGSRLFSKPCGDEDIFISDVLSEAVEIIKAVQSVCDAWNNNSPEVILGDRINELYDLIT